LYSRACKELGRPDPLHGLRLDDRINYLLNEISWEGSFEGIVSEVKRLLINKLELIFSGEKEAIAEWSKDITSGLFTDEPEKAVATIRLCFLASGGEELLQEVDRVHCSSSLPVAAVTSASVSTVNWPARRTRIAATVARSATSVVT